MSSASLAVARHAHPDPARIAALSAAIALNLGVIMFATRPISSAQLNAVRHLIPVQLSWITPPAKIPPPPPVAMKPLIHPPTAPIVQSHPVPASLPLVVPSAITPMAIPTSPTVTLAPSATDATAAASTNLAMATLAYRSALLQFPAQALHRRMHGMVVLRVLVDESGKPIDVVVEHGSGYGLLDRSAREQVLAGWRFEPAISNGKPVRAWARVPVNFDLRE